MIFCKYNSLTHTYKRLIKLITIYGKNAHILTLIKLLLSMIIISHIVACLWNFIQVLEVELNDETNTWLQHHGYMDMIWYLRYIECFYWAEATLMLVGTKGFTSLETLFLSIVLLSCVGFFAAVLSNIQSIFHDIEKEKVEYEADLNKLDFYLKKHNVDKDVQADA